jgi:glycosyltransferase involved in cell wall biosynthesis
VDDGSTDGSDKIMKEYQTRYPNVKVYTKANGGQASARNLGILMSKGEYIGFADSDDYVDRNMYEVMYQAAKENQSDLVECHYNFLCEEGKGIKVYKTRGEIRQYINQKDMFINPQVSPWNKLYRREVLMHDRVDFPEGLIYEDTSFYIKAIPYIKKSVYVNEHFVYYFLRSNSTINANKSKRVGNILPVLQNILDFYKENEFYEEYKEELEYFCVKILLCSSLSRIGRITDKKVKKELYEATFAFIRDQFPAFKQNKYVTGWIGQYIQRINLKNCKYIGKILGRVMKG